MYGIIKKSQVSYTAREGIKLKKVAGEAYSGGQQKKRIKFFFKTTEVVGIKMRKKVLLRVWYTFSPAWRN